MTREKVKFYVEKDRLGVEACMILMSLSIVFRLIGCWGLWRDKSYAVTQIALPVFSALLLIAAVWLLGRRALWVSFIPVTLGAVFFIIKAFGFESRIQMVLCILLYIAVIALYFCTVFGILHTKWFLVALFGLPFLYHIFVEDLPALQNTSNPVTFAAGMQEMGVLCIMLGLFCLSFSMKKEVTVVEEPHPAKKPVVLHTNHDEETEDNMKKDDEELPQAAMEMQQAVASESSDKQELQQEATSGKSEKEQQLLRDDAAEEHPEDWLEGEDESET